MVQSPPSAIVVGAGIGGLAAAISLRAAGWRVRVVERATSPRELGFALALAPNALAAVRDLGLIGAVLAQSARPRAAEFQTVDGRVIRRLLLPGAPDDSISGLRVVLRPVLHGALLDAVGASDLLLGAEAIGLESRPDVVTLRVSDGRTFPADILIGADGVGSALRRCLHPAEPPPRPSGYWAIRGVVHDAGLLGDVDAIAAFGRGIEIAAARASRTAIYWYVSMLASRVGDRITGPVTGRDVIAVFPAEVRGTLRRIADATDGADLRLDPLFVRDPLPRWGEGRVTLLGDAAHPMLPHTGQGAAQALEDAVALGLALGRGGDVTAALRRYEAARRARTRAIVRLGPRIARLTTTTSPVVAAVRAAMLRVVPASAMAGWVPGGGRDPHAALRSGGA